MLAPPAFVLYIANRFECAAFPNTELLRQDPICCHAPGERVTGHPD
jgi:hypothetical protein